MNDSSSSDTSSSIMSFKGDPKEDMQSMPKKLKNTTEIDLQNLEKLIKSSCKLGKQSNNQCNTRASGQSNLGNDF